MKKFIETHFGLCLFIASVVAFLFPDKFLFLSDLAPYLLMFSLFLGFLKIEVSEVFHLKTNFLKLLFLVFFSLFLLPVTYYFLSVGLEEGLRVGLFLIIAVSGAMMSPLLASFMKLKILWTTVFVILTTFLLPISLPFLLKTFFSISADIKFLDMFLFLGKMIFFPALFAFIFKRFLKKSVIAISKQASLLGVLNMCVFIAILVAPNQTFLEENLLTPHAFWIILWLFAVFLLKYVLGFLFPAQKQERWTNALMFGNMNTGLAILFASQFFGPEVFFVTLLSEVPWLSAQMIFPFLKHKFY